MLQIASSMVGTNYELNSEELFVLLAALYLSDIGVCQPLYSHDESAIKSRHAELSSEFIRDFGLSALEIPKRFINAISIVVQSTGGSLAHPERKALFDVFHSPGSFSVHKINLLYLGTIVWLTDVIDLGNLTSRTLLAQYRSYPNFGTSISIWDESDFDFNSDANGETLFLRANVSFDDQLIFLGLHKRVQHIRFVVETVNSILHREQKSMLLKFVKDELQSVFKRQIGITPIGKRQLHIISGHVLERSARV